MVRITINNINLLSQEGNVGEQPRTCSTGYRTKKNISETPRSDYFAYQHYKFFLGFFVFEIANMQADIVRRQEGVIDFASISSCGDSSIVSCIHLRFRCGFALQGRAEPDLVLSRNST